MKWLDNISVYMLVIIALTLGLAPFIPEPHVWEKLKMLANGDLTRGLDIFDLFFHAAPWLVLVLKLLRIAYLAIKASPSN